MVLWPAIAVTALLLISFLCWGDLVLALLQLRLRTTRGEPSAAAYLLLALGIGGIVASLGTLLLGVAYLLYPPLIAAFLALGPLIGVLARRAPPLRRRLQEVGVGMKTVLWQRASRAERLFIAATALVLGVLATALILLATTPVFDPDGLIYHMALPRLYVQMHAITPLHGINELGNKPIASDMWHVIGEAFGVPPVARLLNVAAIALLAATLLVTVYERLEVRSPAVLAAGALVVCAAPMAATLATWSYAEVPAAWYEALLLLALLHWLERGTLWWAVMAGVASGMVMATKEVGMMTLVGILPLMSVAALLARRWRMAVVGPIVLGLAAAIVAGPWYLRSLLWAGDPTGLHFSVVTTLLEKVTHNSSYTAHDGGAGTPGTIMHSTLLARTLLAWLPLSYSPDPPGLPFFPGNLLLLLAPLPALVRRTRAAIGLTLLALLYIYLWQRIPISYRQFFIYLPLLLLLVVWALQIIATLPLRRLWRGLYGAALALQILLVPVALGWSMPRGNAVWGDALGVLAHPSQTDLFLRHYVPGYAVEAALSRLYGPTSAVHVLVVGFAYTYYLRSPYALLGAAPPLANAAPSEAALRAYLRRQHLCALVTLDHDLASNFTAGIDIPYDPATARMLAHIFHSTHLQALHRDGFVALIPTDHGHPSRDCAPILGATA